MKGTPKGHAKTLRDQIAGSNCSYYKRGEVLHMLDQILQLTDPGEWHQGSARGPQRVTDIRRGDVFIASGVGGKIRPWVILEVDDAGVSAVALSSSDGGADAIKAKCRFWPNSSITLTASRFSFGDACKEVTRPFTNHQQLAEIDDKIAAAHGFEKKPLTIGRILSRYRQRTA